MNHCSFLSGTVFLSILMFGYYFYFQVNILSRLMDTAVSSAITPLKKNDSANLKQICIHPFLIMAASHVKELSLGEQCGPASDCVHTRGI